MSAASDFVEKTFPGMFFIPLPAAAKFVGLSDKTARNLLCRGKLPFPTIERSGRRYVPVAALIELVEGELATAGIISVPTLIGQAAAPRGEQLIKRGRGRPRKLDARSEVQRQGGAA